jgi:hypothetical protein
LVRLSSVMWTNRRTYATKPTSAQTYYKFVGDV